jgi:hypothetical protein
MKSIYPRYYAKKRSIVCGSAPSLELVFMDPKKSFKLARFRDYGIEWDCVYDIKLYIKKYCILKRKKCGRSWNKETRINIPLNFIIPKLEKKYGYFLPYNLMKQKRRLKIKKFGYMLDENRKYKQQISIKISDFLEI